MSKKISDFLTAFIANYDLKKFIFVFMKVVLFKGCSGELSRSVGLDAMALVLDVSGSRLS